MDNSVQNLIKISTPKAFKASEYVCFEGQPGHEMYIVLKGSIGVYIASPIGTQIQVAVIRSGDFFGEMAIFDSLPRSASCIALEDTVCVAISKDKLHDFITACPDVTANIIQNMSQRIRKLNDELYKTERYADTLNIPEFALPAPYSFSHVVEEPEHDRTGIEPLSAVCPICGKPIIVSNVKRSNLTLKKTDDDCRRHYKECEPLWYDVLGCPYCHYSNHYLKFFGILPIDKDVIKEILREKHDPVIEKASFLNTPFDQIFLKYIQAIHINAVINPREDLLPGTLWLGLYWLSDDAADGELKKYCGEKALEHLSKAYQTRNKTIPDEYSCQSIAMSLAHISAELGRNMDAEYYCNEAAQYSDPKIKLHAYTFRELLKKR